jgi:adenylosuccinate lyase
MPNDEEPIPLARIIRSLETLRERHVASLQNMQIDHDRELKEMKGRRDTLDMALLYRDCLVDELERVIATLCSRIERTQEQLRRDNTNALYSEPLELINLLGRNADPSAILLDARQKARKAKHEELARQATETAETCACGEFGTKPFPKRHGARQCAPEIR